MTVERRGSRVWGAVFATALAFAGQAMAAEVENPDPWEGFNRKVFAFNDTLDTYALKPVAQGYQRFTPGFVQTGVSNFFNNLGDVRNLANDLLQGNVEDAGVDTARLLMNTTLGGLGLVDVATKAGLQRNGEDFGLTLGKWGASSGPYLVLPFFGPSSVRDAFGRIPDTYTSAYPYVNDVAVRNSAFALDTVNTRANLLPAERLITGDKYIFIRNAYLESREFKVKDGHVVDDF